MFYPLSWRILPANVDGLLLSMSSDRKSLPTSINLFSHHKNHLGCIIEALKALFKDAFVSPCPNMLTRNHECSLPTPTFLSK